MRSLSEDRIDITEAVAARGPAIHGPAVETLIAALGADRIAVWMSVEERFNEVLDIRELAQFDAGRLVGIASGAAWARSQDPRAAIIAERVATAILCSGMETEDGIEAVRVVIEALGVGIEHDDEEAEYR